MDLFANEAQLQQLHQRYQQWKHDGYPHGDERVPPWLEKITQVQGVQPMWSCQGHSLRHALAGGGDFELIFATNLAGKFALEFLYQEVAAQLQLSSPLWKRWWYLSYFSLPMPGDVRQLVPVVKLEYKFNQGGAASDEQFYEVFDRMLDFWHAHYKR